MDSTTQNQAAVPAQVGAASPRARTLVRAAQFGLIGFGVVGIVLALGIDRIVATAGSSFGLVQLALLVSCLGVVGLGIALPHLYARRALLEGLVVSADVSLVRHGLFLFVLLLAGVFVFESALSIIPFDWDNLYAMTIVLQRDGWNLIFQNVGGEPAYRPLAMLTIWLQGHFAGLNAAPYFLFNQIVWFGCAAVLYALVYLLSRSRIAALLSALALLVDRRTFALLTLIDDRQTSLATLFGLLALVVVVIAGRKQRLRIYGLLLFFFLLASALSKEYGLAFCGAVLVYGICTNLDLRAKRPAILLRTNVQPKLRWFFASVLAVIGAYAALRLGAAGGAVAADFCQEQSFFLLRIDQQICFSQLDPNALLAQYAYNMGAAFVGILAFWLLSWTGAPQVPQLSFYVLAFQLPMLCLAILALVQVPRRALPLASLVLFTALLSFQLYRGRNHIIGLTGLYACAGIGLALVLRRLETRHALRILATGGIAVMFVALLMHGLDLRQDLERERVRVASVDPCTMLNAPFMSPELVYQVKQYYAHDNPGCIK